MKKIIILLSLFLTGISYAQSVKVSGILKDSDNLVIETANVMAINQVTKAMDAYNITSEKGEFSLNLKANTEYIIKAGYIGYAPFEQKITTTKASKVRIDLNTADSLALDQVSGIGPAFASRILKYRERLGGFYVLEQLKEVYGVDSAHFAQWLPQLALNTAAIRKIDINTASFEELKRHPYLSYKQINALIQYRKQHGAYANLSDLKNIPLFTDEILRKLAPYFICK